MECNEKIKKLKFKLEQIKKENRDVVCMVDRSILACRKTMESMNRAILTSSFTSEEDEINFFRNIKTFPLSQIIYFGKVRTFEIEYPKGNIRKQKKYIKRRIRKIDKFYRYNIDFIQYINMGNTNLDGEYFTSKNSNSLNFTNSKTYCFSPKFSTSHDALLAKVKGFELYLDYLNQKLNNLKKNRPEQEFLSDLQWTGSKTDLTELIYALYASKVINNGFTEISEIAAMMEKVFDIDLGDFYRTFISIRDRVNDRTKFLEKLKNSTIKFMEDLDQ